MEYFQPTSLDLSHNVSFDDVRVYCPHCHYRLKEAKGPADTADVGAVNFCSNCGNASIFDSATTLRILTEKERNDPELSEILEPVKQAWVAHKLRHGWS